MFKFLIKILCFYEKYDLRVSINITRGILLSHSHQVLEHLYLALAEQTDFLQIFKKIFLPLSQLFFTVWITAKDKGVDIWIQKQYILLSGNINTSRLSSLETILMTYDERQFGYVSSFLSSNEACWYKTLILSLCICMIHQTITPYD